MTMRFVAAVAVTAAMTMGLWTAAAQDASEHPEFSVVERLEAAAILADMGRSLGDPLLLIAAARLTLAVGVHDADDPWSASALLDEAAKLGAGAPAVKAMIAAARDGQTWRGPLDEVVRLVLRLKPGEKRRIAFFFPEWRRASAAARVKRDTRKPNVDLKIFDENSVAIKYATTNDFSRAALVDWRPERNACFTIEVVNKSDEHVDLVLTAAPARDLGLDCSESSPQSVGR